MNSTRAPRRGKTVLLWALSIVVALGIGGAAAWAVLSPPTTEQTVVSDPTYTVAEETITRSSQFTADIAWSTADAGVYGGGGTVTSIGVASGDTVTAGQLLYTVDLKPVYVAQGEVPAFRDLTLGVTGDDVAQLQAFLAEQNHFWANANGTFGPATLTAVKAWLWYLEINGGVLTEVGGGRSTPEEAFATPRASWPSSPTSPRRASVPSPCSSTSESQRRPQR